MKALQINSEICVRCKRCIPYCPVEAIKTMDKKIVIDQDQCVECGVCKRSGVCPTNAHYQPELHWPRVIRALFSDPITVHPETGVAGRGTDELKTNDVTNRFIEGKVGFGIEMGRPNMGTTFIDLEKVLKKLIPLEVYFEPKNPVTTLIKDMSTGELKDDIRNERVLTAIIEFIVDESKVLQVLDVIKEAADEIDTVFSLEIINRCGSKKEPYSISLIKGNGYYVSPNGKVCIGIGRSERKA